MANVELDAESLARGTGLNPTVQAMATADTYQISNTGTTILRFDATGGAATVTIVTGKTAADSLAIGDVSLSVPAGEQRYWGPVLVDPYNTGTTGRFDVTVDVVGVNLEYFKT